MQAKQSPRVDVTELKAQMAKRVGPERFKRYLYYLSMLLSQKMSKTEFDKLSIRVLGKENIALHNQFICLIWNNARHAKLPPLLVEDGHEKSPSGAGGAIWSNGVVLHKGKSGIRDRKLKDRPSPLGPNGKLDYTNSKVVVENGDAGPCDFLRPVQDGCGLAEQSKIKRLANDHRIEAGFVEDGEEVEQSNHSPLVAPLGIPFCGASVGGARRSFSTFDSYFDSGELSDTEMLRKRMDQIATAQGLGGVSVECANMLNNMLDVYLKRLIRSCIELVGARSVHDSKTHSANKQQIHGKVMNGMWPRNAGSVEVTQDQRSSCSISLLDFKVAMELNPQQLGEDWPVMLEKICMHTFEE